MNLNQLIVTHLNEERRETILAIVLDDNGAELCLGVRDDAAVDEDWRVTVVGEAEAAQLEVKVSKSCERFQALMIHLLGADLRAADELLVHVREDGKRRDGICELHQPVAIHGSDRDDLLRRNELAHDEAEVIRIEIFRNVVNENVSDFVSRLQHIFDLVFLCPKDLHVAVPLQDGRSISNAKDLKLNDLTKLTEPTPLHCFAVRAVL